MPRTFKSKQQLAKVNNVRKSRIHRHISKLVKPKGVSRMSVLAMPLNRIISIKNDRFEDFMRESEKTIPTKEQWTEIKKSSSLIKRRHKRNDIN